MLELARVTGQLEEAKEQINLLQSVPTPNAVLVQLVGDLWDQYGGVDHHRDECPEDGACDDCTMASRIDDALGDSEW